MCRGSPGVTRSAESVAPSQGGPLQAAPSGPAGHPSPTHPPVLGLASCQVRLQPSRHSFPQCPLLCLHSRALKSILVSQCPAPPPPFVLRLHLTPSPHPMASSTSGDPLLLQAHSLP